MLECFALTFALMQAPAAPVHQSSARYELEWHGTPAEAADVGRLLEAAFDDLRAFFEAAPKDRLRVRVFRDETARREGAWTDGTTIGAQNVHAAFSEETRTAYVARQPSSAATRQVILYAACLQFHALSKAKNLDAARTWQAWGIALDFARHTWDGSDLRTFVTPLVEPVDLPRRALDVLGDGAPRLAQMAAVGAEGDPSLSWGIVATCLHGLGGKYRDAFRKYALGRTGTKLGTSDFLRTLGPNDRVLADLRAHLAVAGTPFEAFGDWDDRGAAGLVASPASGESVYCVLRPGATRLSATASALPRTGARLGVVVGWGDPDDCAEIDIEAPEILVRVRSHGRPTSTSRHPMRGDAGRERHVEVTRSGSQYVLRIDGAVSFEGELPSGRMGFFAFGAPAAFRRVEWR